MANQSSSEYCIAEVNMTSNCSADDQHGVFFLLHNGFVLLLTNISLSNYYSNVSRVSKVAQTTARWSGRPTIFVVESGFSPCL